MELPILKTQKNLRPRTEPTIINGMILIYAVLIAAICFWFPNFTRGGATYFSTHVPKLSIFLSNLLTFLSAISFPPLKVHLTLSALRLVL